jgi:hypothetical protein
MTAPSIDKIVERLEGRVVIDPRDLAALIAACHERGAMIDAIHVVLDEHDGDDAVGRIRDVLYGGAEDKI